MAVIDPIDAAQTTTVDAARNDRPSPATWLYQPRSIGVVGAHDTRPSLAGMTQIAIRCAEANGAAFYPINPTKDDVFGQRCYDSVDGAPGPVDLLLILTGDPVGVLAGIDRHTPRLVLVFANGFSETGTAEGRAREQALLAVTRRLGARLIGPNTNASALQPLVPNPGPKIALVAQSGHQGAPVRQAQELGVALSHLAPTGNEIDVEATEFIEYFARDPDTAVIAAYIEGFRSGEGLRSAAVAAIEQATPIVMVKVGRSAAGTRMAQSHTGHLTGEDANLNAFFEQYGIQRVDDLDELLQVSTALARCPVPEAEGIAVFSVSGGTAAHLTDLVKASGLDLPVLAANTQAALRRLIPPEFRIDNPVDNGGPSMAGGRGGQMLDAIMADSGIGIVLCPITGVAPLLTESIGEALLHVAKDRRAAVLPIWSGPTTTHPVYAALWDAGLPVFSNFRNAIRAAQALIGHPRRNVHLAEVARLARALPRPRPAMPAPAPLDEDASTAYLEVRGIHFAPRRRANTVDDAARAANDLGLPVVVKGLGPTHKSEQGLVAVDLRSEIEVRAAAKDILGRAGVEALLVTKYLAGGVELLVGATTDPVLGPVVIVGAGGVTSEAMRDVSRAVLPLTRRRAEQMLDALRIAPLLAGWRGSAAIDRAALVDALLRVAKIVEDGEIAELDINPLLARPDGVYGLDALVRPNVPHPARDRSR